MIGTAAQSALFWSATAALIAGCQSSPEQRAVAAVERLGGKVTRGGSAPNAVTEVDLARTRAGDDDLALLGALTDLASLNLSGTAITDRGLANVAACKRLKKLNLNLTKISDAGLAELAPLAELEQLSLAETHLTPACVRPLSQLGPLKMLVLLRTGLGEDSIGELRRALPATDVRIEPRRKGSK